jgi:hypothetical protein
VVLRQLVVHLALVGLGLTAMSATVGAPVFPDKAQKLQSVGVERIDSSASIDVTANEPDLVSQGGALYNPFSTVIETPGSKPHASITQKRDNMDERPLALVTAAVTAFVAAGLLVVLVRFFIIR